MTETLSQIVVHVGVRVGSIVFELSYFSRRQLYELTNVAPAPADLLVLRISNREFVKDRGGLARLTRQMLPVLTGLNLAQLDEVGYTLLEEVTDRVLLCHPDTRLGEPSEVT